MFRYDQARIMGLSFFILCFAVGILILNAESWVGSRAPASEQATLIASPLESKDSKPGQGRSYFDKIFSENGEYKIPYPFNQVLAKLSDYTGQKLNSADGSGIKVAIFPMGRSLQRGAAVAGLNEVTSLDPYFIFPRVVVGVDEEPVYENSLLLNLKNKFYLGFNEKAQVIETITYNDEMGRYEYQVVQNYGPGKNPEVVYANRSLCLSCHQNLAPIFSRGPWSESNANPLIASQLKETLDRIYGKPNCSANKNQNYCYQNGNSFYFGAPIKIESNVTRQLDASTDLANLTHGYQKMWRDLCVSLECKSAMLQAMLLYRLTGQAGLIPSTDIKTQLEKMEEDWNVKFPWGLSIPSPDIPDRDPLKDVDSSAAFEPLQARSPIDIWKNTGFDASANTNRMIRGLAQDFTLSDLKLMDQWLKSNRSDKDLVSTLTAACQTQKDKNNLLISCVGQGDESFSFDAYVTMSSTLQGQASVKEFNFRSIHLNGSNGTKFSDLVGVYSKAQNGKAALSLKFKTGLNLRTSNGYDISEVNFDFESQVAQIKAYNQAAFIAQAISQNQSAIFSDRGFNRFQVMKAFTSQAAMKLTRQQPEIGTKLPMHFDASFATAEELPEQMSGFAIIKSVCAQCHQNNLSTPPNFMGTLIQPLNDFEQCRRVEQCAPRMLYRLKMHNCDVVSRKDKKQPMPPETFFENESSATQWKTLHNPKVIKFLSSLIDEKESPLTSDLLKNACPSFKVNEYEQLPKCEFNKLKTMTRCR